MRICVITHFPSPYQVELFDEVARSCLPRFQAVYLHSGSGERQWASRPMRHVAHFPRSGKQAEMDARSAIEDADLVVFNYYRDELARRWIVDRAASGRPWCFWGERPGFRMRGLVPDILRKILLRPITRSVAPVWGIGEWAVQEYRRMFGDRRIYFNVPYFSNLERFRATGAPRSAAGRRRNILFSGSLIRRKGIDLLIEAFGRVARRTSGLELDILGDGPLRGGLEARVSSLNDRVRFHGFRDWDETAGYYAGSDILCVPSRYDGWGLVVPEGLASGLPVIAGSMMGAAIDLVRPGENGWIVESGSGAALQEALEQVAAMSETDLSRRSEAARESVAHHSLEHGARRFAEAAAGSRVAWSDPGAPS